MTPRQMAKAECCNYHESKSIRECLTGLLDKLLANRVDGWGTIWCLLQDELRCTYFETCLLPLADYRSPENQPTLQARRQRARKLYIEMHGRGDGKPSEMKHTPEGPKSWPSIRAMLEQIRTVNQEENQLLKYTCNQCGLPRPKGRGRKYCESCRCKKRKSQLRKAMQNYRKKKRLK